VEDGIIKAFEVAASEDDPAGDKNPDVTLCDHMLSKVPDLAPDEKSAAMAKIAAEKEEDIAAANLCIKSSDLVLFVKPSCPFCYDAMTTLQTNGFNARVIETNRSQQRGIVALTGKTSLPSCWVNGSYVGGCNDGVEAWHGVKPMIVSGKLRQMLVNSSNDDAILGA
jgi:glutaredoxin 3